MDESIKRDAYLKGLKLKNTGLDQETICIRLEKQGIPYELAKEVAENVFIQRQTDALNSKHIPNFFASKGPAIQQLFNEVRSWFKEKKSTK